VSGTEGLKLIRANEVAFNPELRNGCSIGRVTHRPKATLWGLAVTRILFQPGYAILAGVGLLVLSLIVLPSVMGTHTVAILPTVSDRPPANAMNLPRVDSDSALIGQASVVDGDTIEIHGARIRFNGIDAPESRQTCELNGRQYLCGQKAAIALSDFIAAHTVSCKKTGMDRYRRVIAKCFADGTDLSAWMVSQGWAIAYRKYSMDYVDDEERAHSQKIGIWAGTFVVPEEWRKGKHKGE
jgi:endonuclease YncB( thermonuclease family)